MTNSSKPVETAAGRVGVWSARLLHAAIEGCAFVCTVPGDQCNSRLCQTCSCAGASLCQKCFATKCCAPAGFRTVLAVHGVAICFYLGPSRTASLTFKVALATAGYKFCEVLVNSAPGEVRHARRPAGSWGLQRARQGGHPLTSLLLSGSYTCLFCGRARTRHW